VDGGLFDPLVAQNARVLWFNSASAGESTVFWGGGVILGLVVYNNAWTGRALPPGGFQEDQE
jgi:hypothetical protein